MNLQNFDALQQRFEFVRQNFHQLCRFCLEQKNLLTIFYQAESQTSSTPSKPREPTAPDWVYNDERNVGTLLQKQYVRFNPEEEYGLPNNICERCVDSLIQWHRFHENFITTTKLLLKVRDHFEINTHDDDDQDFESDEPEYEVEEEEEEEYLEDIRIDEIPENNEVYEIEILQNLPENATVEDVTIIETLDGTEALENDTDKKFDPLPYSDTEQQNLRLPIVESDGDGQHDSEFESDTVQHKPSNHRLTVKSEFDPSEPPSTIQAKPSRRRLKVKSETAEPSSTTRPKQRNEQCPICGMIVKSKMKHHMLRHSDPTGQPFKCPQCDKSYSFKRTLADHIRQVHQHVRHHCDLCGKEFVSRDVLRIHKKLHTNQEHRCDLCGQVFQQRQYLRKHMAVHDQKKFTCDDCGKIFRFNEQLKQHIRIHTGEKPFGCEDCPKSFRTSSHLKQHMRSHRQEKVFKCTRCPVEYANKKSLERHVAGAHPAVG